MTQATDLVAGRELNALVAEVMGWTQDAPGSIWWHHDGRMTEVPLYSTDIAAAWQVVAWLREHTSSFHIEWESVGSQWQIVLWTVQGVTTASAATAPEAICRAALAAAGS